MRFLISIVSLSVAAIGGKAATIEVAPNILVSRESALPKVEMMVAANPKNPKNLVGTAIAATAFTDECTVYSSSDGGNTWKAIIPTGLPETGSGDPQVAFGADGVAYFSALGLVSDETGKRRFAGLLYRSLDGGLTWEKLTTFGLGTGPDHDMMVADAFGRLFISVVYRQDGRSNIGIYRLDPGQSTLHGPLRAATGSDSMVFTWNPVVFSDGTLFVPFQASNGPIVNSAAREIFAAVSIDAGATFAKPERIGIQTLDASNPVNPYGNVAFAVDATDGRYRDRLYMLWNTASPHTGYRLQLKFSTDKGKTWSAARDVDQESTSHSNAFRPAVSVNGAGVLGISWLDTRGSASGRTYREYFTASTDGGTTFRAPVTVSSVDSSLDAEANFASHPTIDSPRSTSNGTIEFSFNTTLGRCPDGGDYLGLTADPSGTFHPLWVDTRTGTFQAWTAAIRVDPPTSTTAPPQARPDDLARRLRPVFDPASYDPQTRTQSIPVRFQNISDSPVCAPLMAIVRDSDKTPHRTPRILNAGNQKEWDGASFDYSPAFRDNRCLAPGEISEAIVWRVQPLPAEKTFVTISFSLTQDASRK